MTPKTYIATTDLIIDSRRDPVASANSSTEPNSLATQIAIIRSERAASSVVRRLKLPETDVYIDRWKKATNGSVPIESFYSNMLRKGLQVEPLLGSNVIQLSYEGSDPKFVTDVVNNYAQAYLTLSVDLRVEPARQNADWFDERLKSLRQNVEMAQAKLSEYQRKKGIIGSDQRADQETQRLDALMAQLVSVQGENMAIGSRQKTSGGEISPDVQASPVVQGLRAEINKAEAKLTEMRVNLGPNHPQRVQLEGQVAELKQQLAQEVGRVSSGTDVAKTSASLRENELRGVIAAQKERVISLRAERDQVAVLVQDVEAAKRNYDSVLERSSQLNLEKQTDQANVSILSPALEPTSPSKPNIAKYMVVTLFGALAAAMGAALGLESLNRKVRVEQDILIDDVPLLGTIERRSASYTARERWDLSKKFFTNRKVRKEIAARSRLAELT
jgi:chain length determinant protein EpsF